VLLRPDFLRFVMGQSCYSIGGKYRRDAFAREPEIRAEWEWEVDHGGGIGWAGSVPHRCFAAGLLTTPKDSPAVYSSGRLPSEFGADAAATT